MSFFHFRWRRWLACVVSLVVVCSLVFFTADAWAAGTNVGQNVGNLLKGYAADLYGGIVAAFSLVFLWNRRYVELATFLFAAVVLEFRLFR